jgi:hypothetical protein
MSDGPRSWNLEDGINLSFKDKVVQFPTLNSIEEAIENLFICQCSNFEYQTENFLSKILDQKIAITLFNESFLFDDILDVETLELNLCNLFNQMSEIVTDFISND